MKQVIDYNAMVLNGDNPKLDKLRKKYHDCRKNWCTEVESGTRFRFKVPQKLFALHVDDYLLVGEVTFTKL